MSWINKVFGPAVLLFCVWITRASPMKDKGDQILATFSANVDHGSYVNGHHNTSSAIDGSVNAQLSTIKGSSLEQLFQRIGEVISKMVANAGGSIVPSIHDDSGRNRVEFNISVTAQQHNNVSTLQERPRDESTSGTQREATGENYSTSLDDDSERARSPATFQKPRHRPGKSFGVPLSPAVQGAKNSNFAEGSRDEKRLQVDSDKEQSSGSEYAYLKGKFEGQPRGSKASNFAGESKGRSRLSQMNFDEIDSDEELSPRPKDTGSQQQDFRNYQIGPELPRGLGRYPNSEGANPADSDEEISPKPSDGKVGYQQQLPRFPSPGGLEKGYSEDSEEHTDANETSDGQPQWGLNQVHVEGGTPLDQKSLITDITPIKPYSDLPHVHNGENYAEFSEDVPTIPGSRLYPPNSKRLNDQQNVDSRASTLDEEPQTLLSRGPIFFSLPSEPTDTTQTRSERQYIHTGNPGMRDDLRRIAAFDHPQRYSGPPEEVLERGLSSPRIIRSHPFIQSGVRQQQIVKQPQDNLELITSQGIPYSGTAYFGDSRALPTMGGSRIHYFDKTPAVPEEKERAANPRSGAGPFDSPPNPADLDDPFKQDLTDGINDIGSTSNEGIPVNAFINPVEENPYFPEVRETRKQPVPALYRFPPIARLDSHAAEAFLDTSLYFSRPAQAPDIPEDTAPAETLPLEGEQPSPLSTSEIKTPTGYAETSKNTKFGTEFLSGESPISSQPVTATIHTTCNILDGCMHPDFDVPDADPSRLKNIDVLRAILFREFLQNLKYSCNSLTQQSG